MEVATHFGHNLSHLRRRASLSQAEGLEEEAGAFFDGLTWQPGHDVAGRFATPTPRARRADKAAR